MAERVVIGFVLMAPAPSCPGRVPMYTLYPMMARPPSDAGASHVSLTFRLPATAFNLVGAPGTVAGAFGFADASFDAAPVPAELIAFTVKKYFVPFVNGLTLNDVGSAGNG